MPTPKKGPRLASSPAHERLMLANMATSLFQHGRITTTLPKAKRLRPLAERLITLAKRGDLHNRRRVMRVIRNKSVVHKLFTEIAEQMEQREGGYTRIVKIAPRRGDAAPDGFDARFSALERTYVYRIADRSSEVDPRTRNFVLHIDDELDLKAMNEAAAMTIGLHDFGSFATPNPGGTTIREVKTAYWRRVPQRTLIDDGMTMGERYRTPTVESGLVCFVIVADAFARNMVRSLVNGCVQVGIGKRSLDWFAGKMAAPLREGSTGPIAPQGLTLEHIEYPADDQLAVRAEAIRAKRTL